MAIETAVLPSVTQKLICADLDEFYAAYDASRELEDNDSEQAKLGHRPNFKVRMAFVYILLAFFMGFSYYLGITNFKLISGPQ